MDAIIEILNKTGIFFYPIAVCSIIGTTLFIEKMYFLRGEKVVPSKFIGQILHLTKEGELNGAKALCEENNSPVARVSLVAIDSATGEREDLVDRSLENESLDLYAHIEMLGAISSVSTLLGLLGTISGMIKIFGAISLNVDVNPASLAGGISEALYTTAMGLCVAIPIFVGHKYLLGKYEAMILSLEQSAEDVVKSLKASGGAE